MGGRIVIIGAGGQIGVELVTALREKFGNDYVIATDIKEPELEEEGIYEKLDVLDREALHSLLKKYKPTQVYHLAGMLSAIGEQYPQKAWELNVNGLLNVLDVCLELGIKKIFWPSSIAVFGPGSPKINTPQHCVMDPTSIYGISKLAGERLCAYYHDRYGLDIRSIRYPGVISWKAEPGGGTTDYAVHIYFEALCQGKYTCFLSQDTELPMMYMEDAVKGTIQLMDAPSDKISIRSSYNLSGMSFTPLQIAQEIQKILPNFDISYSTHDPRQAIADTWPKSIDDTCAREDWGWQPVYDLEAMTRVMLDNLKEKV